jgi:predicted GNAT family acetyltransferase
MTMAHPLDRPIRTALTTRHAERAIGGPRAWRYRPDVSPFAATTDDSTDSLCALVGLVEPGRTTIVLGVGGHPVPPGVVEAHRAAALQMVADTLTPAAKNFSFLELGDADAPEMLALATLTRPGPYAANSHHFGGYIGIRLDGRLVAMAGERLQAPGFTEVSAVCTHPDYRRRGYAAMLSWIVATRILDRGETPFLHAYATNVAAIRLYESLGFKVRTEITVHELTAAPRSTSYQEGDAGLP